MTGSAIPVGRFVLRTVLWLPACFTLWYLSAHYLGAFVGELAAMLVELFKSGLVSAVERQGMGLEFVTHLLVHPLPGRTGVLVVEVNPLLYTYGLPLFVALMLASRAKISGILVGAALLLPFQAWGVAFDLLAQLAVRSGVDVSIQAGLMGWRAEFIALAYQIGSLIFPALIPVALWVAFNRTRLGATPVATQDDLAVTHEPHMTGGAGR